MAPDRGAGQSVAPGSVRLPCRTARCIHRAHSLTGTLPSESEHPRLASGPRPTATASTASSDRAGWRRSISPHDLKHDRQVALKVLHPELSAALGERFLREIKVAARLGHPHILTVLDSGEADGLLCYTMPDVDGESLRARLRREARSRWTKRCGSAGCGRRAGLRPRPRRGAPGHQAGEHPALRQRADGRRLRHRPGRGRRGPGAADPDRARRWAPRRT